eukprot:CAMPEP_0119425122 /NCGR_PEP_ID=MMETSP1335-20130426/33908_1 /TAXON_ID=259385 /ORGANISM="Chrysoculter rhomboideus, Strain RCC1486" /LENGTH=195 /DNA_ID=CAMNT_0007450675 /DNA_START=638 /DNA_END=1225 /DNA_ORIENTATION=-
MPARLIDTEGNLHVKACVVEGSKHAHREDEEEECDRVGRYHRQSRKVQVLADKELHRVHVHRVEVATRGHHLLVVVLVHPWVYGAHMEQSVPEAVEEVIEDEERRECHHSVHQRHFRRPPLHRVAQAHVLQAVVHKGDAGDTVEVDEELVLQFKLIQMLPFHRQLGKAGEQQGHDPMEQLVSKEDDESKDSALAP